MTEKDSTCDLSSAL